MSQACSISVGRIYGLQRVCRVWHVPRSTVYQHRSRAEIQRVSVRRGPQGPCPDEELVEHIKDAYAHRRQVLKATFDRELQDVIEHSTTAQDILEHGDQLRRKYEQD